MRKLSARSNFSVIVDYQGEPIIPTAQFIIQFSSTGWPRHLGVVANVQKYDL